MQRMGYYTVTWQAIIQIWQKSSTFTSLTVFLYSLQYSTQMTILILNSLADLYLILITIIHFGKLSELPFHQNYKILPSRNKKMARDFSIAEQFSRMQETKLLKHVTFIFLVLFVSFLSFLGVHSFCFLFCFYYFLQFFSYFFLFLFWVSQVFIVQC